MKASLDTNVIIHLYRAGLQNVLFEVFRDGVFIYEQIRDIELENHGKDVLAIVDADIVAGKIKVYTNERLKKESVDKVFLNNVKENRLLYGPGDMGEVYAISLAQTIGMYTLVTDDTKRGGPYMSLLQLEYDVMPLNFTDVLILRYLFGGADEKQTIIDFDTVNACSDLRWSLRSKVKLFVKRFLVNPYKEEDKEWMEQVAKEYGINVRKKIKALAELL